MTEPPDILAQLYWHAPHLWPVAAAIALVGTATVLWLYRAQLGAVSGPWRFIVPGLRIAAVLAVAASVAKPVAVRSASAEERGQVLVLVDRSRSMGVTDNGRTPAQLVALADALGKLPAGVRLDRATSLSAGLERLRAAAADVKGAQEDLEYARVSGRDIDLRRTRLARAAERYVKHAADLVTGAAALPDAAELQRLLADLSHLGDDPNARDSWRATIPQRIGDAANAVSTYQATIDDKLYRDDADVRHACAKVAELSRFALVEQALLRPGGGLVARLRREAAVSGFAVAADVIPLELTRGPLPAQSLDIAPDGDGTDLTAGIARAVAGRPVRAVVLLSDGRQVGGDSTVVSGLTPNGVPVFAVSAAAPVPPRDLSFASLGAPSSVFVGQSITVRAEIRHDGFDGPGAEVHCRVGNEPEQVHRVALHEGRRAVAEFTARLTKPGAQRIEVWFPKVPGEASEENNRAGRWVKVVPERLRVLLVAGAPTWDFQYVRNMLSRLGEVQLKEVVLDPSAPKLHVPAAELLQQDVIVLFDVPVAALDERRWDAVDRVAQNLGGSVILVAGDAHLPAEYYKLSTAAALLPFRAPFRPAWRVWPGDDPALHFVPAPQLSEDARDALQLAPADAQDGAPRRWEQLPGVFRFLQLPDARDEQAWRPGARALLLEEESRLPVLTEMRTGAGRAFFLGIDETWRWRFRTGERDQERFWWQLIQYASEEPHFARSGPLALDADRVSVQPDEPVRVRARITDEPPNPPDRYTLQIVRDGKLFAERSLVAPKVEGTGRYTATVALPAGDYQLRWTATAGTDRKVHTVQIPLHVAATSEAELANLAGDERMLHKLADASGGEFLTLEQINRLPERIGAAGDARSRLAEMPLWDGPYLFALVVGSLGAEWALRKRLGLA